MVQTLFPHAFPILKDDKAPIETTVQTQQWFDKCQKAIPQSQDLKLGGKFWSKEKLGKAEFSAVIYPTTPEAINISLYADREVLNTHMPAIPYHLFRAYKILVS